jgi:Trk K+ transport system NAD-binding subunit
VRVILRIFDPSLAKRIETGFGFETAFSTSALAAPAFAMAAVDPGVVGIVDIDGETMVNVEMKVRPSSKLDGMKAHDLRDQGPLSLLMHKRATGERDLHPTDDFQIQAGDTLLLCLPQRKRSRVEALNAA